MRLKPPCIFLLSPISQNLIPSESYVTQWSMHGKGNQPNGRLEGWKNPPEVMPERFLQRALELAVQGRFLPPPNPAVGCVIVSESNQILGEGHTQKAGGPHAEIVALADARSKGHDVKGATAYVTLEPCSHHGRTGPCCDALVNADIARVVSCCTDPNPKVAGEGFARLRSAGVKVEVLAKEDPLAVESRELNIGFFSRMQRNTPWVRMKVAASMDGITALPNGKSQWITSAEARADGHAWRARACAVLTGIGTVLEDKPRLDVRLVATPRQPHVVVVDSQLQTPPDAPLLMDGRQTFIYHALADLLPAQQKITELQSRGATLIHMPGKAASAQRTDKVDLNAMLLDLAKREINEVHVEAGHKLNGSLLREGLVDEMLVYLAPKMLGQGALMSSFGPLSTLDEAKQLEFRQIDRMGCDLRLLARISGRGNF